MLLNLGLSGYDVKPRFGEFQCEYLLQNPLFLGKNFDGTRHLCEKNEPTLDHSGGGARYGLLAHSLLVCYAKIVNKHQIFNSYTTT